MVLNVTMKNMNLVKLILGDILIHICEEDFYTLKYNVI